ncbi:MAG TPA: hypothetical protein DCY59_08460 [Micrococcaceae bacterium]|jgi:hypothetical protein|nr:hypothetical protein [Micrococcaceae bacterium]
MASRDDDAVKDENDTPIVHKIAQPPSEQLAHFNEVRQRKAKPMQRLIASPEESAKPASEK